MFLEIGNTPRPYAWGSTTAIAELLGTPASGGPEAELWLGTHPGSPARIVHPGRAGGARDLAAWLAANPEAARLLASSGQSAAGCAQREHATSAMAEGVDAAVAPVSPPALQPGLPFLLKVLAASAPLSLQAHPTMAQAVRGFAREQAAGVPADAAHRNYKDASHKPELIVALSERFSALSGFRELEDTRAVFDELLRRALPDERDALVPLVERLAFAEVLPENRVLRNAVSWLLGVSGAGANVALDAADRHTRLVAAVTRIAEAASGAEELSTVTAEALATVRLLAAEYPGDPGIVLSLLLNTVHLGRGEALYLPAGNIHAYLHGLGVELMAASDNVLRGGLTAKHIDVPELLSVLDFSPLPPPHLRPDEPAPGVRVFRPGVPEFQLVQLSTEPSAEPAERRWMLRGPAIVLCTAGEWAVRGAVSAATLGRGQAHYITADEQELVFAGSGELFLATTDAAAAVDNIPDSAEPAPQSTASGQAAAPESTHRVGSTEERSGSTHGKGSQ